jgi:hypothetical protein
VRFIVDEVALELEFFLVPSVSLANYANY